MKPTPSTPLSAKHLREFEESGIPKDIAEHCFISLTDSKEIAQKLMWKGYSHTPGWWCEGVNPETGKKTGIGQFKPNRPFRFPDGKEAKYLSQKNGYDAILVDVPNVNWPSVIEDVSTGIRITEGVKKAVSSMFNTSTPTIALLGVDMGLNKRTKLVPSLERLASKGRPFELCFDSDISEKEGVREALLWLGTTLKRKGCVVTVRSWSLELGKGLDDIIVAVGDNLDEFSTVSTFKNWLNTLSSPKKGEGTDDREKKAPQQSKMCLEITEKLRNSLCFDINCKKWYLCDEASSIWNKEPDERVKRNIKKILDLEKISYSEGYLSGLYNLLKVELGTDRWNSNTNLLPFLNGILDLKTLKLEKNNPERKFNWVLPYNYSESATCEPIIAWLQESVRGNTSQVQVLRAYLAAILRGRVDLQKYIELTGPGGTGKGTFIRLAQAIVGVANCYSTTLSRLENNRFELAAIAGKRLVTVGDSDQFMGATKNLMSLIGQDSVTFEEKNIQQGESFYCSAMFILASNEPMQGDLTSGLWRRRIVVNFENQVAEGRKKDLLSINKNGISGEFADSLPGLIKWCLEMPESEMVNWIQNTSEFAPSLTRQKLELLLTTNPIADWADTSLIYKPGALSQVGLAKKQNIAVNDNQFLNCDKWLYASYSEYCLASGTNRLSVRRFTSLLKDLFNNQLKLNIEHLRNKYSYVLNIAIRQEYDDAPSLISGSFQNQESNHTEVEIERDSPVSTNTQNATPQRVLSENADAYSSEATHAELTGFIRKAIEINDKELALQIKEILSESCEKGAVRERVWNSLSAEERTAFKELLNQKKSFLESLGEMEFETTQREKVDFSKFPSHKSASAETRKNQALQINNQLLRAKSSEEIKDICAKGRWERDQLEWVFWVLMPASRRNEIRKIITTPTQLNLWDG